MSLPPSIIQIKRKATDEPLEFLRVHESSGKRQRRANDFVFSRQTTPPSDTPTPPHSVLPAGRRIKPLHRASSSRSLANKGPLKPAGVGQTINEAKKEGQPASTPSHPITATTKQDLEVKHPVSSGSPKKPQRRFHISRSATPTIPPTSDGGIRKRTQKATTVFVERRVRQKTSQEKQLGSPARFSTPLENVLQTKDEEERPRKKPGRSSRVSAPPKDATKPPAQSRPPPALVNPWGLDADDLAAQMQAYILQEIGRNILESQSQSQSQSPTTTPSRTPRSPNKLLSTSKFKPKKPALRYKERHPEASMEIDHDNEHMSDFEVEDEDMDTDSEYIIDTYIRLPAEDIQDTGREINFGLLVLDSQPDIDEFYRDEKEEEEEDEDDVEEDENAENHYSADYPDEEVESDDEFGRNAYAYRTGNASDLEEWDGAEEVDGDRGSGEDSADENEMGWSDDEVDRLKFPWMRRA
ncbi:hypothetical protein ACMFMG_004432 [Clarireedia jacksonii]